MDTICCYDISHYENPDSFHSAYDAGYILAICKSSQGLRRDDAFAGFVQRLATIQGQLIGAYHYLIGNTDPIQQADFFLNIAHDVPLLCLDWEPTIAKFGGTPTRAQAESFVSRIKSVTGKYPLLYGGSLIKETTISKTSSLLKCELWLSQYGPKPVLPSGWDKLRLWQFTGDGVGPKPHDVPGVGKNADISKFPGTVDDCRRWYASLSK